MRGNLGALCGLQWLEVVSLSYNSIAGELPPCLNAMVGMTSLDVGYNLIDGMVALEELIVRGNRLRGTVPACLGDDLKNLQVIDFSNVNVDRTYPGPQSLEGTLPITLCNLPALVRL